MRALFSWLPSGLASLACASEWTSSELVDARSAYREASVSRAANFSQERLGEARQALDRAEGAHEAAPGAPETRALAYVALRRAELAKVSGDYEFDRHIVAELREKKSRAAPALAVSPPPPATESETTDLTASGEQSLAEQHDAAEFTALGEALSELEPLVTSKKEEPRGMLITLDGSFLFVPKKAELVPGAREKLQKIARALVALGEDKSLVVEGHTDSNGPDAQNLTLSRERADAVKSVLVSSGVPAARVRAEGRGETAPAAPNDTAEGRAMNRRIEIVVSRTERP